MPKKHIPTRASAIYFNAFERRMGARQLAAHLESVHEWWKLRDAQGRNALMHAVNTRDVTPELLSRPHMTALARATDDRGRNLYFYLVRAFKFGAPERRDDIAAAGLWLNALSERGVSPCSSRSKWGLVVQQVMEMPKRSWSGFLAGLLVMAEVERGRKTVPKLRQSSDWSDAAADLWWGCSEGAAETVAHWMTEVRPVDAFAIRRVALLADHTLRIEQRARLPRALRGALLLNDLVLGASKATSSSREAIEHELAAGVSFELSDARRSKFRSRLSEQDRRFFDKKMTQVDDRRLRQDLPLAEPALRRPRL